MLAVGDDRREDPVGEAPDEPPGERVQGERAPVAHLRVARGVAPAARAGGEVDEPGHHRRGAVHGRGGGEAPEPVPGRGAEGHEVAVVGADVDPAPPNRGGRVDVGAGALRPQEPAARGAEGVERPVRVPDEDAAVRDRRRRVEELPPPEARERAGAPAEPAGARVQRVEAAAVRAEVHLAVRERRRTVDLAVGRERPARLPGVDVDRVELVVPRARVQRLPDDEGRGLEHSGAVAPDDLPRPRRHRGDHPGLATRVAVARQRLHPGVVDDAVGDGRRRRGAVVEPALPDHLARPVMDGEEAAALLGEIEAAVGDRGRELEDMAGLERPAQPVRRAQLEVGRRVRPLDAQAVGRPREAEDDPARARRLRRLLRLRGHELLGRRAALVVDRPLLVEPDADEKPRDDGRRRHAGERQQAVRAHPLRTTTTAASRRPDTSTTSA